LRAVRQVTRPTSAGAIMRGVVGIDKMGGRGLEPKW
jgi:hypothetical protein